MDRTRIRHGQMKNTLILFFFGMVEERDSVRNQDLVRNTVFNPLAPELFFF